MENGEQPFFGSFNLDSTPEEHKEVITTTQSPVSLEDGIQLGDIEEKEVDVVNKEDEIVEEEQEIITKNTILPTPSYIKELAKEFLSGYQIDITEENGEVKALDLETDELDLKTVVQLIKNKHEDELQEIKANSISTKNLEQAQKEIIDIIARNGNPNELIQLHKDFLEPLSQMDVTTEEGQEQILVEYYNQQRTDPADIDITIEALKNKGLLEDRAIKAKEALEKWIKSQIELKKKEAEEGIKNIEKAHKEFSKNLVETFKTKQGITKDVQISKLKKFATEYVEDAGGNKSRLTAMDAEYTKLRNNPEEAAELALFFYDREEYLRVKTKEETNKDKLEVAKKITMTRLTKPANSNKSNFEKVVDNELTFNIGN